MPDAGRMDYALGSSKTAPQRMQAHPDTQRATNERCAAMHVSAACGFERTWLSKLHVRACQHGGAFADDVADGLRAHMQGFLRL